MKDAYEECYIEIGMAIYTGDESKSRLEVVCINDSDESLKLMEKMTGER